MESPDTTVYLTLPAAETPMPHTMTNTKMSESVFMNRFIDCFYDPFSQSEKKHRVRRDTASMDKNFAGGSLSKL
jgi:hypothetical protein